MPGPRYTWSRVAHNVVEHLARPDMYGQPICGRQLSNQTQTFGPRNDNYPECRRCAAILRRIELAAARFIAESRDGDIPAEPTDENLSAAFATVVLPINPELYPLVRDMVNRRRDEAAAAQ